MTTEPALTEELTEAPLPVAAHEAALAKWQGRVAVLGDQLAEAEAKLDAAETQAARAALEGQPLPETLGQLESEIRALKRARAMASEEVLNAEAALEAARRAEAAAAADALGPKLAAEAAGLDDCLAELAHRMNTLGRLGRQHEQLARAAGRRRRATVDGVAPSALAGAILHAAPELFQLLQIPRPPQDSRQPLAAYYTRRFAGQIEQVLQ